MKELSLKDMKEVLKQLIDHQKESNKSIEKGFQELVLLGKETDKKFKETDERLDKKFKETDERLDKKFKETDERLNKKFKETDKRLEKGFKETRALIEENTKDIKELKKQLGNIGFTQGEVAEDLISRNVRGLLEKRGMNVKEIKTNEKKSREYDIIVENGKEIVLVEVKNKVRKDDIDKFLEKQIPAFKKDYPKYKSKKIFGGIGGLVFRPDLEKNAEKRGLYVFTQNGEGGAVIANKKKFKPTAL